MFKILKSITHDAHLVNKISTLSLDGPSKYSDVTVLVGIKTFYCHKLILALASNYFEQRLFGSGSSPSVSQIRIDIVLPDDFRNVLRYMYTGEVELCDNNIDSMFKAAVAFELLELKEMCVSYMLDTLDINTCTERWKLAAEHNETKLTTSCKELFLKEFHKLHSSQLQYMTEGMMKDVMECNELCVDGEIDVCEMLLEWLDHQTEAGRSMELYPLLTSIRWSGVSVEYIKSKLLGNSTLQRDPKCFEFLSKVVSYQLTGVQSEGICTFHRRSTGLEKCVVIVGLWDGSAVTKDVYRLSLQRSEDITSLPAIKTSSVATEAAACIMNEQVYVVGTGSSYNETWMWSSVTGWTRCGDMMVSGRRRHCLGVVANSDMYAVGGYIDAPSTVLTSIEQYNRMTNKWKEVGSLVQCTMSAASVVHRTSIYVFGGNVIDATTKNLTYLDCVQLFDTSTKSCTVLTQRLPTAEPVLRAVLWDKSVILMNNRKCFVFNIVQQSFEQRTQFVTGVAHCGMVLENQTIYIIGGGTSNTDNDGKTTWTFSDEVKRVHVMDIINNKQTANWVHHAKLPQPALIHAFAVTTLPSEQP